MFVDRRELRRREAPSIFGSDKTLCKYRKGWGKRGVFLQILQGLTVANAQRKSIMIGATYYPGAPHLAAANNRDFGHLIGCAKGGMNTQLYAVDANGRPLSLYMTAGKVSN